MYKIFCLIGISPIILFVGTGLYTQFPGVSYFLVIPIIIIFIFLFKYLLKVILTNLRLVLGIFIFNIFLIIEYLILNIDVQNYMSMFISTSIFLCSYLLVSLYFYINGDKNYFYGILLLSLISIYLGQMAQVYGYLDILAYSGATQEFLLTSGRPGGFLNPNESSCIAIVLLHTIYTEKVNSKNYIYIITFATAICLLIVLLSQSRAAIIFLSLLLFFNINIRYLFIFLLSLIIFNLIYENEIIYDLFDNLVLRFYGDYSSEERGGLIFSSIESFMQSPLYGNGADYLVNKFGYASHNQLLDILSSYGIVGLIFITVSVALIYIPCSASFVFFCITPFFLFSHNFFNSISFGAIMGISLAFNRFHKIYYQSKNSIYIL